MSRPGPALRTLAAVPLAFLGWFFVYPIARISLLALAPGGRFDPTPFAEVVTDPGIRSVAFFTLWQAVASTIGTLVLGLPAAYVFARYRFPGRRLLRALMTVPFVLPTLVVASAFVALVGPGGLLGVDLQGTVAAILLAHVFYNVPIVIRGVGAFWEQVDPAVGDAARTLGASPVRAFRTVTLPLLVPALASTAALVFLFTFTSFGVILVLGGFEHATIEVEIWRQTVAFLRLDVAAALSLTQLGFLAVVLAGYNRLQARRAVVLPQRPGSRHLRTPRGARDLGAVAGILGVTAAFLLGPLVVLVRRALLTPTGFGLDNFVALTERTTALFVPPVEAISNSLRFAAAATVLAVLVGVTAAVVVARDRGALGRGLDLLLMLPLAASAVTIGFGLLVSMDRPVDLRRSTLLLPIAHALVAVPFVVRAALPAMRAIGGRLREAAAVLGASPWRAWRTVEAPLAARALAVGTAFAFAVSLGEFGATAFLARPAAPTLPIAIFRLLGQPGRGTIGPAMALSVVLLVLTVAAIAAIETLRVGGDEL